MIYGLQAVIFYLAIFAIIVAISYSIGSVYSNYSYLKISEVNNLERNFKKYQIFFLALGFAFIINETLLEVIKIRPKSELILHLYFSVFCFFIYVLSNRFKYIRKKLHHIFLFFFLSQSAFLLYKIFFYPIDFLTLIEYTILCMFSYYAFYNIKHFYFYLIFTFAIIFAYYLGQKIDLNTLILFTIIYIVSVVFNFFKHVVDLNLKQSLFFANNLFNNKDHFVIAINSDGIINFVSENTGPILELENVSWAGKRWEYIFNNYIKSSVVTNGNPFIQKIELYNGHSKLIEWNESKINDSFNVFTGKDISIETEKDIDLKNTKKLLEETNRVANVGGWEYDLLAQKTNLSALSKEILGVHENTHLDLDAFLLLFKDNENNNKMAVAVKNCINLGTSYDFEVPLFSLPSKKTWIRVKGNAEFLNGSCVRIFGIIQDISERISATKALVRSEENFKFISDNISDAVLVFQNFKVIYLSPAHESMFGYSHDESIKMAETDIYQFVHEDEKYTIKELYANAIKNNLGFLNYTFRFKHKNGSYIWREDTVNFFYDENRVLFKHIVIARDVNSRKEKEISDKKLKLKLDLQHEILLNISTKPYQVHDTISERLQTILASAAEGLNVERVSFWEYSENIINCAYLFERHKGYSPQNETFSVNSYPIYFEHITKGLPLVADDVFSNPHTQEIIAEYFTPLNIKSVLDIPILFEGRLIGVICFEKVEEKIAWQEEDIIFAKSMADIIALNIEADKRRKIEQQLKFTKDILEKTNLIAKLGAWGFDYNKMEVFFSNSCNAIFEAPKKLKIKDFGLAIDKIKYIHDRELLTNSIRKCKKDSTPFDLEIRALTFLGNDIILRIKGQSDDNSYPNQRIIGTIQDITETVTLNEKIKESEKQYRSLISNISSVAFRANLEKDFPIIFMSDAIETLTGYPAADFILSSKRSYTSIVHPDDIYIVNSNEAYLVENNVNYNIEYRILDSQNNVVWVNETGQKYYDNETDKYLIDGVISNITERKLAEIALNNSFKELNIMQFQLQNLALEQEKFVSLVKYADVFIGMADLKGKVIFLNEKAKNMSGVTDISSHPFAPKYHPKKTREFLRKTILPQMDKIGYWRGELEVINFETNEIRHTDATMFFIKDPKTQKVLSVATVQIDITEKKAIENQLKLNQKQLWFKSEILNVLAKTTEKLLVSSDIHNILFESFKMIGELTKVDQIFYVEYLKKENVLIPKVKWNKETDENFLESEINQSIKFAELRLLAPELLNNKIKIFKYDELTNLSQKERWEKNGIKSEILFPISIKSNFYGFIGFQNYNYENLWSEDLINLISSFATNISNTIERLNNEALIKESESNFRQLNENLEDVYMLYDLLNKKCIYISPICEKVLGVKQEYFFTKNTFIEDFVVDEDKNIGKEIMNNLTLNNASEVEFRIKTKANEIKWISQKSFGIKDENGTLVRTSAIFSDITIQKNIQNEIKQLSLVSESVTSGVIITDPEGRVIWANKTFLELLEIPESELINKRPQDLFDPGNSEFIQIIPPKYSTNYIIEIEALTFKKNLKWIQINNTGIFNERGELIQQIEIVNDITNKKLAEMLLKESEEKFRLIAENTSDGIFVTELNNVTYCSPSFEKITGYTFKEFADLGSKKLLNLLHPDDKIKTKKILQNAIENKQSNVICEYRTLNKDGEYIWREDNINIIYINSIPSKFIIVVRDITERKKALDELKESENKLNIILNALDELVWAFDFNNFKILFASKSYKKIYGKTAREWEANFQIWKEMVDIEDKKNAEKFETDVFKYGSSSAIYRIIDANGTRKWIQNTAKIVKDNDDNPIMVMGITSDITSKKNFEIELEKSREEVNESNRLRAELELRALQMQMNPHFIFNALNSIQSFVMEQDLFTANSYLSKFAQLIRLFLDSSRSKFISIVEEIKLLKLYIELEKLRFDDKFDFEIEVDNTLSKYFEIPTMILQPFIENAINHGLRYKKDKGLLKVIFSREGDYVVCIIEDNGVGRENVGKIQSNTKKGYKSQGLKITSERLRAYNLINESEIEFTVSDKILNPKNSNEDVGTIIKIKIPMLNQE